MNSYCSRSGHQVAWNDTTWSHFFAYLALCQSCNWWPNILKLGEWYKVIRAYNLRISDFPFGDVRSSQFLDLPIISKWERNQIPSIGLRLGDFIINWVKLDYCWWSGCKFRSVTVIEVIWGHLSQQRVFDNNSRFKRARDMGMVSYVCFGPTYRLIYDMT